MLDILLFIEFGNFYCCFIENFSKMRTLIIFMLKTTIKIVINENLNKFSKRIECGKKIEHEFNDIQKKTMNKLKKSLL